MMPEQALCNITALIVQCCDPDSVLLFGSYAKGQDNLNSDIDILVIGDFPESPYLRGHEIRELLRQCPIHIDLHLLTTEEITSESHAPFGFLRSVMASSVILYEKQKKDS